MSEPTGAATPGQAATLAARLEGLIEVWRQAIDDLTDQPMSSDEATKYSTLLDVIRDVEAAIAAAAPGEASGPLALQLIIAVDALRGIADSYDTGTAAHDAAHKALDDIGTPGFGTLPAPGESHSAWSRRIGAHCPICGKRIPDGECRSCSATTCRADTTDPVAPDAPCMAYRRQARAIAAAAPAAPTAPEVRCSWWSDPSDDLYGRCTRRGPHNLHENEFGIQWAGQRWSDGRPTTMLQPVDFSDDDEGELRVIGAAPAAPQDAGDVVPVEAPHVHVTMPDGSYLWLECFSDDPDADTGQVICQLDAGESWDELAAKVRVHQSEHRCALSPALTAAPGHVSETVQTTGERL